LKCSKATSPSSKRSRGTNTQGDTLEDARENLREAVKLVLEANRELDEKS
jgi:predicted RNase H-like HicB family nuclease